MSDCQLKIYQFLLQNNLHFFCLFFYFHFISGVKFDQIIKCCQYFVHCNCFQKSRGVRNSCFIGTYAQVAKNWKLAALRHRTAAFVQACERFSSGQCRWHSLYSTSRLQLQCLVAGVTVTNSLKCPGENKRTSQKRTCLHCFARKSCLKNQIKACGWASARTSSLWCQVWYWHTLRC